MNVLISCILCLVVSQVTSEYIPVVENSVLIYSPRKTCAEIQGDGLIGCSDDCSSRRYCLDYDEVSISCTAQTGRPYCDPTTLQCLVTPTVCDNTAPDVPSFSCPGKGLYPYALGCSKFWSCEKNKVTLLECKNSVFDTVNKKCATGISCYSFSPVNGLCKGKNNTFVIHPLNKAVYALCSGSFPKVRECPASHVFNTNKLECEFVCKTVGNFVDPLDQKCFYTCTRYSTSFTSVRDCCDSSMKFNETIVACTP